METVIKVEFDRASERYTFWFTDVNSGELACDHAIGWESATELLNIWTTAAKQQGINLKVVRV